MAANPATLMHDLGNHAPAQVLTFSLEAEQFGVDIRRVLEIRGWSPVTRIPRSPSHVLGVLNLRGTIVPTIDLRIRLGLPQAECTPLTVIIVLSVKFGNEQRPFGLVVDQVSDVVDVDSGCLRELPALNSSARSEWIQTLAVISDQMLILLDIDELLKGDLATASALTSSV